MYNKIRDAFHRLFEADERTFKFVLSQNMQNLERQLKKEILYEKDFNSDLRVIKVQFEHFIHSKVLEPSNYNSYDQETRRDFKEYTQIEPQAFKDTIIQNKNSIEQCIVERASHEQELQNGLKRIVSDKENDQRLENQSNTSEMKAAGQGMNAMTKALLGMILEKVDSNVIPDSLNMCDNDIQTDQNAKDERDVLANLIANLKLDIDENKTIQRQLKKENASLTQELKECKYTLAETSRTLGLSNSIQDSSLVALQNQQTEFERYKAFNDRTVDNDKLERKLNETLGLLAQKEIDIKEGLKVKAYEISVVKEKHDELVKQSILTKSHYEGLVKEKIKVITDMKLKEEKDIDKMISMEKN
nr:hypothetical protein [Tanacetum cinerariifolium]